MKNLKFPVKIVLLFLLVALTPMIIAGLIAYRNSTVAVENEVMHNLSSQADLRAKAILSYVAGKEKRLIDQARRPIVVSALREYTEAFSLGVTSTGFQKTEQKFRQNLVDLFEFAEYYDLFFISPNQDIVFSIKREKDFATNLRDGPFRASGLAETVNAAQNLMPTKLSAFERYVPAGLPVAFFAAPVLADGENLGVIAGQLSLEQVTEAVTDYVPLRSSDEIVLATQFGNQTILLAPLRLDPQATDRKTLNLASGLAEPMRKALQKENGQGKSLDYRNVPVIAAWRYIPGLDWGLVVKIDIEEGFAGITAMNRQFLWTAFASALTVLLLALLSARSLAAPIEKLIWGANQLASGDLLARVHIDSKDEFGTLGTAFNAMAKQLQAKAEEIGKRDWLKQGSSGLEAVLRGTASPTELSHKALTYIAEYLDAPVGTLYLLNDESFYSLAASYAYQTSAQFPTRYATGEGLVGQAADEGKKLTLDQIPDSYLNISSSLGHTKPQSIVLIPISFADRVIAVVELGSLAPFSRLQHNFLDECIEPLGIAINAAITLKNLLINLQRAQTLGEELQTQQEELRVANEEMEEQTQLLRASEEQLRNQQDELQTANEELEEKSLATEEQKKRLVEKNRELQETRLRLERQAADLATASKYKSEFLANMSHELRTPLNSLLILSQDLAANKQGNLQPDQVEAAEIVYSSGKDLLKLINEILDLAKIEAGKITLAISDVELAVIAGRLQKSFAHMAEELQLEFNINLDPALPATIRTDPARLEQILKNLIANALKFTEQGSVSVSFAPAAQADGALMITVTDTGIGIPAENLQSIFTAFHQVDGSISRNFCGTGLGLSISKELTQLLGGELQVASQLGSGSTFTLTLPPYREPVATPPQTLVLAESTAPPVAVPLNRTPAPALADDRDQRKAGDRTILIIEDDLKFARILADLCRERQFKYLHAGDGETGLALIEQYSPDAVILDIKLPGMQGLEVLETVKNNPDIRHIPIHMMSVNEHGGEAFRLGAIGYLQKPTDRDQLAQAFNKIEEMLSGKIRKLLIVEDNLQQQKSIQTLIGNGDVESLLATSGAQALEILAQQQVDCMILDLNLPDLSGFELLQRLDAQTNGSVPPIIVYTGQELNREEVERLQKYTQSIIIKGVQSPERLLDEASLFLHRVVSKLPEHKQKMIASLHDPETLFIGKKILLTDDDMRTVFAISKILEGKGMQIFKATNGQKALDLLASEPQIDLVLMDIMMPVMDGFEAIRRIRAQKQFSALPIIALTAKVMSADRDNCIAAGANDYLTKPVDIDRLLSLLRVWLYRN